MTRLSPRVLSTLVLACGLASGCAGDSKNANSPDEAAAEQPPVMTTTPPAGDDRAPAPNGQPPGLPQAEPPPQGLNSANQDNVLAAPGMAPTTPAKAALSEGQIARIADLANTAEIEQGKLAQAKAKNARVREFAAKMVNHHGQAKTHQGKLAKQLNIVSAESPDAAALKSEGETTLATLKSTPATDFDVAYIDSQVTAHQKVLATIDGQLLPSAKNEGVVSALRVAREAVARHLDEAKALQSELARSTSR